MHEVEENSQNILPGALKKGIDLVKPNSKMIENWKGYWWDLFTWLNSFHTDWLDPDRISDDRGDGYYGFFLCDSVIYFIYGRSHKALRGYLGGAALTILIFSDQVTSGFYWSHFWALKTLSWRTIRRSNPLIMAGGGLLGFVSSHCCKYLRYCKLFSNLQT